MARPLRIGMISYYLPSGSKIGVGYQAHALANALTARGHEVTLFSGCSASDGARYTTRTVALEGSNRTFKFAWRLRQVYWSGYDVLHAHGDDYWLWGRKIPAHVRTMHGSCFSEARWVPGARERVRMLALGVSEVVATRAADVTIAVSQGTRRWMPWVRRVIPNGVDCSRLRPLERSAQPSILFVGTYAMRKRGALLARAFEEVVRPALPDAELWMVCEDAPQLPGVKVLGRVSDTTLAELYGRAWVFCLPSVYEGFGIPYIEAMAAGCPVVATPNQGAVEVTAGGRWGLLSTDAALGETLARLLGDAQERERLARAGLERSRMFDLDAVASAYEEIYRELVAERG